MRELENAIEHAFVMCGDEEIRPEHLPKRIVEDAGATTGIAGSRGDEGEVIREALRRHGGNRERVARELGVHRSTLWRKIKAHQIED